MAKLASGVDPRPGTTCRCESALLPFRVKTTLIHVKQGQSLLTYLLAGVPRDQAPTKRPSASFRVGKQRTSTTASAQTVESRL